MLSLLLLLSGLGRLTTTSHQSETSLLQIIVPQKIGSNSSADGDSETQLGKHSRSKILARGALNPKRYVINLSAFVLAKSQEHPDL
ncbi:hypothetical protein CB1_000667003 [Camelus ferus]|nr:hypothetical protein CB1_000667003 [Camelus ferus]